MIRPKQPVALVATVILMCMGGFSIATGQAMAAGGQDPTPGSALSAPSIPSHADAVELPGSPSADAVATLPQAVSADKVSVTTPLWTAPKLPVKVRVEWTDGGTSLEPVIWEAIDPVRYEMPGEFTVAGTVRIAGGGVGQGGESTLAVEAVVTVPGRLVETISYDTDEIVTDSGVAPAMPTHVDVTYVDGTKDRVPLVWEDPIDQAEWSLRQGGVFYPRAHVTVPDNFTEPIWFKVTVRPATVVSIAPMAEVTTTVGVAPNLPPAVAVAWSNGETTNELVVWDLTAKDYAVASAGVRVGGVAKALGGRPVSLVLVVREDEGTAGGTPSTSGTIVEGAERAPGEFGERPRTLPATGSVDGTILPAGFAAVMMPAGWLLRRR